MPRPQSMPAAPSLLLRLRNETRPYHERAESLVGLPGSLDGHVQTLAQFFGFIEPLERAAADTLAPLGAELAGRQKAKLLEADLAHFGVASADLPRCRDLPSVNTIPAALGAMYVFEGATLGGQIVARHIEQNLGLSDGTGYTFHRSYGSRVGEMWRQFGAVLTSHSSPDVDDSIVASASETFQRLCDWFARPVAAPTQWSNKTSHSTR